MLNPTVRLQINRILSYLKVVYRLATERGLCVAVSHTIYRARGVAEFDDVARQLAANDKARAIVMFVQVNVRCRNCVTYLGSMLNDFCYRKSSYLPILLHHSR